MNPKGLRVAVKDADVTGLTLKEALWRSGLDEPLKVKLMMNAFILQPCLFPQKRTRMIDGYTLPRPQQPGNRGRILCPPDEGPSEAFLSSASILVLALIPRRTYASWSLRFEFDTPQ